MIRLVQLQNGGTRAVAVVEEPHLRLLKDVHSIYELAAAAVADGLRLTDLIRLQGGDTRLDYDPIYAGRSEWHLLAAADHPLEPARCLVSGTADGPAWLGSAGSMAGARDHRLALAAAPS